MKMKIYMVGTNDKWNISCKKWYKMKLMGESSCLKFKLDQYPSSCLLDLFTFAMTEPR